MKDMCGYTFQMEEKKSGRSCFGHANGMLLQISSGAVVLFAGLALVLFSAGCAVAQVSSATSYEIPLDELQKVRKERPPKREVKERKKKKSGVPAEQKSYGVVVQPENAAAADVTATPKHELGVKTDTDTKPIASPLSIHHEPYSYVIAGKRTVIQAVISSASIIQSAYCRFRSGENGTYAQVPMQTAPGTYFTFSATLPGLAASSKALRYAIVAVDSAGNEIKSLEYSIDVKNSAVIPGWQLEESKEPLKIKLENKEKPLEGFSDSAITE
jgi:hypothetical protein